MVATICQFCVCVAVFTMKKAIETSLILPSPSARQQLPFIVLFIGAIHPSYIKTNTFRTIDIKFAILIDPFLVNYFPPTVK